MPFDSVTLSDGYRPGERTPTRLSPALLGCPRRKRRRVFAAALTRYLKPVHAAVLAGIGIFLVADTEKPGHGK
jgi:hypothetical protein